MTYRDLLILILADAVTNAAIIQNRLLDGRLDGSLQLPTEEQLKEMASVLRDVSKQLLRAGDIMRCLRPSDALSSSIPNDVFIVAREAASN